MISIQLPDGSKREFAGPVTVADVAASIGPGLAKAALAGRVGEGRRQAGRHRAHRIDARREARDRHRQGRRRPRGHAPLDGAPAGLRGEGAVPRRAGDDRPGDRERLLLRLLVQAAVHAGGPARRSKTRWPSWRRRTRRSSAACCRATRRWRTSSRIGEHYKAEIIASIPAGEEVSLYREGRFEDLCRGPHVPCTGKLKHFKLMKVAGAYWRGDHRNEQLQRIYGTAWATKDELQQYLHGSRRPRSATTASSAASSTCSTSTTTRRAWCSGTRRAGRCGSRSSSTCAASTATTATSRSRGRRSSTARCGRRRGTGTTTARTCSRRRRRSATTR